MRKRLLPLLLCLALLLSACSPAASGAAEPEPEPVQEPTDSLTVYIYDWRPERYINQLRRAFEQSHPGVTLEIITVEAGDETEDFSKLATELAAGRGPDLYIGYAQEFKDFYKVLNTGVFCDLAPYMEQLEQLDRSDYVENILDTGLFHGKLCFVPLTWYYPGFVTTQEALDRAGIGVEALGTYSGLMQAARRFSDTHGGNSAFCMTELGSLILESAGISYLNEEALGTSVDTPEFREMMDAYKLIYPQDQTGRVYTMNDYVSYWHAYRLQNEENVFINSYGDMFVMQIAQEVECFTGRQTSLVLPIPTVDGKTDVQVSLFAAVNANSPNKANAVDMIGVFLQEELQIVVGEQEIPVHKGAIRRIVKQSRQGSASFDWEDDAGNIIATWKYITPADEDYIVERLSYVDSAYVVRGPVLELIFTDMEPYFKDEQTYEACLQKLQSDLTIYLSE